MAAPTTTDAYDEYVAKLVQGGLTQVDSWNVGLYDDSTDTIVSTDTDPDVAITTEPTGNGYTTKTVTPSTGASVTVGADSTIDVDDQTWSGLTFSVATPVDAFYISATITLAAGADEYLLAVGTLNGAPHDLQDFTEFTAQDVGVSQTQA